MAYALFAQEKITISSLLNSASLQQTQRSNEQFKLASNTLSLQQQLSSIQAAQSLQLSDLYGRLSSATDETQRNSINAEINKKEALFEAEIDQINKKIYLVEVKENTIEMDVKRLDTIVSKYEKELEAIEKAESKGIENSTPQFQGVG